MERIVMPDLGHTVDEVRINRWLKKEGEPISQGEILLEVATDKANVEVESFASGIVRKVLFQEGDQVPVGSVIAIVAEEGKEIAEADLGVSKHEDAERQGLVSRKEKKDIEIPAQEKVLASPLARRMALEHGLDLRKIKGTGPGDRITKEDVEKAMSEQEKAEKVLLEEPKTIPLEGMRRVIAIRMTESFRDTPHLVLKMKVDMREAIRFRMAVNRSLEDLKITFTDLILKSVGYSMSQFPQMNCVMDGDKIKQYRAINIGLAVSVPEGLIVPTIPDVDRKSIAELARYCREAVTRVREGRLNTADLAPATFTLSNLGMFGVDEFVAIINPPQSGILAVGRIVDELRLEEGQVIAVPIATLTLSADHRIVDGVLASQFLGCIKQAIETPFYLLLE